MGAAAGAAGGARRRLDLAALYDRLKPQPHPVHLSVTFVAVAAVIYGALFFGLGAEFLPGSAPFAALLIWLGAVVGADIAAWLRVPRVVGMLLCGLLLQNVPNSPVAAFPPEWGSQTLQRYKVPAIKLAFIPGLVEMCFDAAIAVAVFQMPVLLAFTLGSLLQAVGPALLVPLLFDFQQQRLGTHEGAPQSAIVSASFDDIVAITWFSIFSCLAITGQSNVAWDIARGPVQIVAGVIAGLAFGCGLACTRALDTERKRVVATYFSALLIMFFLVFHNMLSGGALGALVMGMTASACWRKGLPRSRRLGLGPAPHFADDLEATIAQVWDWVAEPMIFGSIGASISFCTLPASVIGRAVLIVTTGLAVRMLVTYFTMFGREGAGDHPYPHRSRLFFAVAWTPKATVQAALSGAPLHLVRILKQGAPDYAQWTAWGEEAPNAGEEQEQLTAIAAQKDRELGASNPESIQGSALTALLVQYLGQVDSLKRLLASDAARRSSDARGGAAAAPALTPAAGAAAAAAAPPPAAAAAATPEREGADWILARQSMLFGGALRDLESMAAELSQLEEHIKAHIAPGRMGVRRALALDPAVQGAGAGAGAGASGGGMA
ncbi:MAG: Sodium/hydrogen exchanger family-domain-containing protein [Monoraphidium minutum]|nr:MAG: Sodium/hydrogen exchanger family-domain-containing protein [Monoraphidium minutum]